MKKKFAIILSLLMLMSLLAMPAFAADPAAIVVLDGKTLSFDVPPINDNGRTLVPLRAIFEAMGAKVDWVQDTKTATAVKGDTKVVLTIGSLEPTINGTVKKIDVPGKIVESKTLAPLRFVCEAFGGTVDWNAATKTASITSAGGTAVTPPADPAPTAATAADLIKTAIKAFSPVKADMNLTGKVNGTPYGDIAVSIKGPAEIDASKTASAKFNADTGALGAGARTAAACPFSELIAGPEADGAALVSAGTLTDGVITLTGVDCPKSMIGILSSVSDTVAIDFVLKLDCKIKVANGKVAEVTDIVLKGQGKTALGDYPSNLSGSIVYTY